MDGVPLSRNLVFDSRAFELEDKQVTGRRVYLDHNASAPLLSEARAAMLRALDEAGNPSSVHAEGRRARAIVEAARADVAALVGADPACVVFTSGASEAAATCLAPGWTAGGEVFSFESLAVGETDHPCFRDAVDGFDGAAERLPADETGRVAERALEDRIEFAGQDALPLLGLTLANGETGVITDLAMEPIRFIGRRGTIVLDAAQAAGRLPIDMASLPCAALVLSGHKLGAMTGVGAYVLADPSLRPSPLIGGGRQENGRRAGTEAVAAIASFGAAAAVARRRIADGTGRLLEMRAKLEDALMVLPGASILGRRAPRLPNTVSVAVEGLSARNLQMALDLEGFAVSAGSACLSGKVGPSHVLRAMAAAGAPVDPALGAVRVSFGFETPAADLDAFAGAFLRVARRMSQRLADCAAA